MPKEKNNHQNISEGREDERPTLGMVSSLNDDDEVTGEELLDNLHRMGLLR